MVRVAVGMPGNRSRNINRLETLLAKGNNGQPEPRTE
jgi:hypothetical protein